VGEDLDRGVEQHRASHAFRPPCGELEHEAAAERVADPVGLLDPERVRRAVLLDPAIQVLPHVAAFAADAERRDPVYASAEAYADARDDSPARELVLEDAMLHCDVLPDGRLRRRTYQPAMVSIYGELATAPPPPDTLRAPTLLVYAPAYGLVRDDQLATYADRVQTVGVPGMHMVMWDAFDEVADAVERFLAD
jgi:pimeloyl-ACP methyl ester carboxylesterase